MRFKLTGKLRCVSSAPFLSVSLVSETCQCSCGWPQKCCPARPSARFGNAGAPLANVPFRNYNNRFSAIRQMRNGSPYGAQCAIAIWRRSTRVYKEMIALALPGICDCATSRASVNVLFCVVVSSSLSCAALCASAMPRTHKHDLELGSIKCTSRRTSCVIGCVYTCACWSRMCVMYSNRTQHTTTRRLAVHWPIPSCIRASANILTAQYSHTERARDLRRSHQLRPNAGRGGLVHSFCNVLELTRAWRATRKGISGAPWCLGCVEVVSYRGVLAIYTECVYYISRENVTSLTWRQQQLDVCLQVAIWRPLNTCLTVNWFYSFT